MYFKLTNNFLLNTYVIIHYHKPKIYWISFNLILIFLMVSIGGITRLTDSGLSMTEWSLIGGIIPPLTANDWIETFININYLLNLYLKIMI